MSRLPERVIVITGASAGIGRATAERVAAEGATVVLSARRGERLEEIAEAIRHAGGHALAAPGDVTSPADMEALVTTAVDRFGQIDVMVCNAGIGYHGTLDETSPEAMRRLVDVNVMGTLYAGRAALMAMRRQGHGHIIAVSSIAGRRGVGGSSVYSATKAAQIGFIEGLRSEFVGTPFHASVVFPVATTTEFHDAMARDFGHRAGGRGPRQSADAVARAITDCIVSPRAEVYPYRLARALSLVSVAAPALTDRIVRRFGRHRSTPTAGPHDPDHS